MYGIKVSELFKNEEDEKLKIKFLGFKSRKKAEKFLDTYFEHCTDYATCQIFKYKKGEF